MNKSVLASLVLCLVFSGCSSIGHDGHAMSENRGNFGAAPVPPTQFKLKVDIEGLVALVQKPKSVHTRMWVLLPYTGGAAGIPKGCQSGLLEPHFPAVRVKTRYLSPDPNANGEQLAIFYLNGADLTTNALSAGICPKTNFTFDDSNSSAKVKLAKMKDFASSYSAPSSDCSTDDPTQVAPGLVAGRVLIDNGTSSIQAPIQYKNSDVNWCFPDTQGGTCNAEYKPLGEQLEWIQDNCSLMPGTPLVLSFGANGGQLPLYPKKDSGGVNFVIEFEVVNLSVDDLFTPFLQITHKPTNSIDHFVWFYELAGDSTITKACPIPETKDIPQNAAGKPYCPLIELDPAD